MITVFTPTYNRAYTLKRLYISLCHQTNKNFEWLIVDDGSTDDTKTLVQSFVSSEFPIKYIFQQNGGKHRAINRGIMLASGEWFFIVDSDDYLTDDAIEQIQISINTIKDKKNFCGVVFNRFYNRGKVLGTNNSYDILDTDFLSYRTKYRIIGDRAEIIRTSIMKQFPFPEIEGEKFCPEGIVWNRIAKKYIARYVNKNIYICDYLEDGLTKNILQMRRKSPKGSALCELERYNNLTSFRYKFIALGEFWSIYKYLPKGTTEVKPTLSMKILRPLAYFFNFILWIKKLKKK